MDAIQIIEEAMKTHEEWLAYFSKHPEKQSLPEFAHLGGIACHKTYVKNYKYVISQLEALQAKVDVLKQYAQHKKDCDMNEAKKMNSEMEEELAEAQEFLRTARPFSNARAIMCIWCGEAVLYADSDTAPDYLVKQMKAHDLECPRNPFVTKIKQLQAKVEALKEYAQHKKDCSALRKFYWQKCPKCESTNTKGQEVPTYYSQWTICTSFYEERQCLSCGHSWKQAKKYGDCTCGLQEILKKET